MTSLKLAAFSLIVSTLPFSPAAANEDAFQSKASAAFAGVIEEYKIPGLVVGMTKNGEHGFYATGLASSADNRPVNPDTLFELGSISKVFNVTLAALAEQRGQLSLDDKVSRHLCADACSIGNDMILMDLATHHSGGLPLQVPDDIADTKELVNWLQDWQPPQPGTRSYSNISIGLLGHIAASAMEMDYTQAVETVLIPAFGLENTFIDVPAKAMDNYAFGYERKTDKPIRVTPGVLDAEAYGIKSSARDMLKLLDVELGNATVSPELKAAVERTREGQFRTAKFTQDMIWEQYPWPVDLETMVAGNGYDFILHPQKAERIKPALAPQKDVIINKTGSTNGFGGYVVLLPRENLGIVVLANRNYPNEARVRATYALIEALLSN
ncbi:beta-lactamase class C [Sinorhizobium terangae]|uniref:Beta-lactamase n=1 Tax=Sinorhizobium terangae TaxID=110322 RepID=A0A6N7LP66_SINTE|nr:class C beta-lactamase [Sinorhizobium terangae]MBB4189332.1 beta-lactamase class C [Sinorhizobium terangae]MQX18983.1 class C beta-lactamase [Sinorhizobium terangae]MQX19010.1 class C beta-lactamase [Sinorhizobium terangae]